MPIDQAAVHIGRMATGLRKNVIQKESSQGRDPGCNIFFLFFVLVYFTLGSSLSLPPLVPS